MASVYGVIVTVSCAVWVMPVLAPVAVTEMV
jgi:hypothetical protein